MKRNFEDKAIRMARLARMEDQRVADPRCLICRHWREMCPACAAPKRRSGKATGPLTPKELAELILEGRL
jgi:hypothetical protein